MIELIDDLKYLYLRDLSEPRDNSLRIIVQEAILNNASNVRAEDLGLPELSTLFKDAVPIESTAECRTFEIYWKHYAAYLVTEELVGSQSDYSDEVFTGRLFRRYEKSHFLQHLERDTGGHIEPLVHYKLVCLNHLIDVAAYAPPEVKRIAPATLG